MEDKTKPKDPYEKMVMVEETFMSIFKDAIHVETKTVKTGGTSGNVYVPKKYDGHPVTVIIWDKDIPGGDLSGGEQPNTPGNSGAELPTEHKEEL